MWHILDLHNWQNIHINRGVCLDFLVSTDGLYLLPSWFFGYISTSSLYFFHKFEICNNKFNSYFSLNWFLRRFLKNASKGWFFLTETSSRFYNVNYKKIFNNYNNFQMRVKNYISLLAWIALTACSFNNWCIIDDF